MKYKIKKYVIDAESPEKAVELVKRVEETNFVDFDYLLGEERKAVKDYQNAIEATEDKDKLYVLSHILTEETHHIELLENLRQGKVEFADSVKDSSMTATQEDILMQYAVKYHVRWKEIEQMFEEFIRQGMNSKAAVDEVINKIKNR